MMILSEIASGYGWTPAIIGELTVHEAYDWFIQARRLKFDDRCWQIDVRIYTHTDRETRQSIINGVMGLLIEETGRRKNAFEVCDDVDSRLRMIGGSLKSPAAKKFREENQGRWQEWLQANGFTEAQAIEAFESWRSKMTTDMIPAAKYRVPVRRTRDVRRRTANGKRTDRRADPRRRGSGGDPGDGAGQPELQDAANHVQGAD